MRLNNKTCICASVFVRLYVQHLLDNAKTLLADHIQTSEHVFLLQLAPVPVVENILGFWAACAHFRNYSSRSPPLPPTGVKHKPQDPQSRPVACPAAITPPDLADLNPPVSFSGKAAKVGGGQQ